jgi:thioredoxin-related protein
MKNSALSLLIILFLAPPLMHSGEKKELKWKNLDAGITEAKKTKKKILMDIYTDWCVWCKKLDKEVYTDEKVAGYLDSHYVLVKLNAESGKKVAYKGEKLSETEIAQGFGVTGYPTLIFLEPNGDAINRIPGFLTAEQIMPILHFIGEGHYKKMSWLEYQQKNGITGKAVN